MAGKNMTLTVDDQKWIKLLFDRQDEAIEELLGKVIDERDKLLAEALAEVIQAQNQRLFAELEKINKRLDSIELRLDDGDKRIERLEKFASVRNTIIRHAITVGIGIAIGWLLHSLL